MGPKIRTKRDVWLFVVCVGFFTTVLSELTVLGIYLVGGDEAFHMHNAVIMCAISPFFIGAPFSYLIAQMNRKLQMSQSELKRLADTDPLTGLPNRRSFFEAAEVTLERNVEQSEDCSVLVIDADFFKDLNDNYGHAVGDQVLVLISQVLQECLRQSDLICRIGGEEFAVLLPGADATAAQRMAQRIVDKVNNTPLQHENTIIEYSVSCGVADTSASKNLDQLIRIADDAMYLAKAQGRNRVALQAAA